MENYVKIFVFKSFAIILLNLVLFFEFIKFVLENKAKLSFKIAAAVVSLKVFCFCCTKKT